MERVFVSIDYDEETGEYHRVAVTGLDDEKLNKDFDTGDPVQDWANMLDYICELGETSFYTSSSVDFFTQDVSGYFWEHEDGHRVLLKEE